MLQFEISLPPLSHFNLLIQAFHSMAPFYSFVRNHKLYSLVFHFGIRPKHPSNASEISIRPVHPQPNIASDQTSDFNLRAPHFLASEPIVKQELTCSTVSKFKTIIICFDCCLVSQSIVLNNAWFTFYPHAIADCWNQYAFSYPTIFRDFAYTSSLHQLSIPYWIHSKGWSNP